MYMRSKLTAGYLKVEQSGVGSILLVYEFRFHRIPKRLACHKKKGGKRQKKKERKGDTLMMINRREGRWMGIKTFCPHRGDQKVLSRDAIRWVSNPGASAAKRIVKVCRRTHLPQPSHWRSKQNQILGHDVEDEAV